MVDSGLIIGSILFGTTPKSFDGSRCVVASSLGLLGSLLLEPFGAAGNKKKPTRLNTQNERCSNRVGLLVNGPPSTIGMPFI
jgi:hypothetical protein